MTQLTKNFSLQELTKSETALRLNIPNRPGKVALANLTLLAEKVLQPTRDHFKKAVKVNSGYRSPAVNTAIGGAVNSDHMRGMAADIEIPGLPNAELAFWIRDNLKFTQLILEFYTPGVPDSGWVHVSYDPKNLKCECLTATRIRGRVVYKPGLIA